MLRYLILTVLLPCLCTSNTQCSDGITYCPEGKTCCKSDDIITCCALSVPLDAELQPVTTVRNTSFFSQHALFATPDCTGTLCFNGYCCPFPKASCCGGEHCCQSLNTCCAGTKKCCQTGTQCCNNGKECCLPNEQCCGDQCCPSQFQCCGSGNSKWCCEKGTTCGSQFDTCRNKCGVPECFSNAKCCNSGEKKWCCNQTLTCGPLFETCTSSSYSLRFMPTIAIVMLVLATAFNIKVSR